MTNTERTIVAALIALPFLIYWPVVWFPYFLMDDNWLLRGWTEPSYPSKGFVTFVQGRPALMAMAWLSSFPVAAFGETGIQIMRLAGIAMLSICAVLTYAYTRYLPLTTPFRFLAAAMWVTLPPSIVIIANGAWLTVGIAAALGATLILLQPLTWWRAGIAVVLLWLAASTYQSCFFIAPALYLLTLYNAKDWRPAAMRLGIIVVAFVVYFIGWKVLFALTYPDVVEKRYNPNTILALAKWPARLVEHFRHRLSGAFGLWAIPAGVPDIGIYVKAGLAVLAGAVAIKTRLSLAWLLVLAAAAIVISEIPALASPDLIRSYTTAIGTAMVVALTIAVMLARVISDKFAWPICAAFAVFGAACATLTAYWHYGYPIWSNQNEVRAYIERRIREAPTGPLALCYIGHEYVYYPDSTSPAFGRVELTWSNFIHPFYSYWHSRSVMDYLLRQDSSRAVVTLRDGVGVKGDQTAPTGADANCADFLDLSGSSKRDLAPHWFRSNEKQPDDR